MKTVTAYPGVSHEVISETGVEYCTKCGAKMSKSCKTEEGESVVVTCPGCLHPQIDTIRNSRF